MAKQERGLRFQPAGGTKAAQVPTGKKQRLNIERLANDGRGIAFIEGRTWFVAGALAGEEVEARVLDLGCGAGHVSFHVAALVKDVVAEQEGLIQHLEQIEKERGEIKTDQIQ